jgi:hypothetical protein
MAIAEWLVQAGDYVVKRFLGPLNARLIAAGLPFLLLPCRESSTARRWLRAMLGRARAAGAEKQQDDGQRRTHDYC